MLLSLPTDECGMSFCLFKSSFISFSKILQLSEDKFHTSFIKCIPKCFILFALVNGIFFNFYFGLSIANYRKTIGFFIQILYPVMLLNLLMSSDSFLVDSLGFSIYSRGPHSYWNWASQQEVSGGASKRSFICIYSRSPWLILLPVRSAAALGSHRSGNPTVNCACEGSRWRSSYENLMPGDLRWS